MICPSARCYQTLLCASLIASALACRGTDHSPPPAAAVEQPPAPPENSKEPQATGALEARRVRAARRLQLSREVAAEDGWNLYETEHYFLATPVDDPLLVEGTKIRLETMYQELSSSFPPGSTEGHRHPPLVRIRPARVDFIAAGGQATSTGFWVPGKKTLELYDGGDESARGLQTWPALQHIVVHEYFGAVLAIEPIPPWLLFGVAAHFEALRFFRTDSGESAFGFPSDSERWRQLAVETAGSAPPPLGRFLEMNRDEFHGLNEFGSSGFRNLIISWSIVTFLKETRPGFLERYVSSLTAGMEPDQCLEQALGGEPISAVDQAWREWIQSRIGRPLGDG